MSAVETMCRCGRDLADGFCIACPELSYRCGCDPAAPDAVAASPVARPSSGATINLAELLTETEGLVRRFVSLQSADQSAAVALWVAHCYVIESAPTAAYLRITSAVEESGKSTLLEVLRELLGSRAIGGESISPSAVFRTRDKIGPVAILLDEIDNTLKDRKDDGARDLLAIVNAGYRRAATAWRVVGKDFEPRAFKAFGPCAVAGLGTLAATTESRCIPIVLERKDRGSGERWLPFRLEPELAALRDGFESWIASDGVLGSLRTADPKVPTELRDRQVESWWSLFAIADLAGGDWPARARNAAIGLHTGREAEDTMSTSVLLLSHIRKVFDDGGTDRMSTAEILHHLVDLEAGPWARWWSADVEKSERPDGPPARKAGADLSAKLKPFRKPDGTRIKPHVIKFADGATARGYLLEDFADAFPRYLGPPDVTDVTNVTPLASTVTSVTSVTSGNPKDEDTPSLYLPRDRTPDATPCSCGAASAEPGYHGHSNRCPNYYPGEVPK
jgi:hypothetical protein